jgi:hypothetical protein
MTSARPNRAISFNSLLVIDAESPIDPQYIIDDEPSVVGVPGGI